MGTTLITGAPGAGKTSLALSMLLEEGKGRLLLVDGVKDLQIPHEKLPPLVDWTHEIDDPDSATGRKLVFTFPENAVVMIDEAQRIYRPRGNAGAVPPHVAALETHRHGFHDVWLVTQHPGLLDANVRKLVNRHLHIKRNLFGGRKLYEWADEVGEVENRASRDLASSRSYKPPKRVFRLFTSATGHTQVKHRVPKYAIVGVVALLVAIGLGWRAYKSMGEKLTSAAPVASSVTGATGNPATHVTAAAPSLSWADAQRPRVSGLPHTAPVFDGVTTPKVAPFPAACIKSSARACTCYTEQATKLAVSVDVCEQIVSGGFYDATRERQRGELVAAAHETAKPAVRDVVRSEPIAAAQVIDYAFTGSHVAARPAVGATAMVAARSSNGAAKGEGPAR